MKKILAMLLVLCMILSMVACGTPGTTDPTNGKDPTTGNDPTGGNTTVKDTYTYNTYTTALGTNWNPHTWEMNSDSSVMSYIESPLADMTIADNAVVLDCSYFMRGYDYTEFVPEICKMLAAAESFKGEAYFIDGSSEECTFTFSCDNGTLNLRSVYYPIGYCPTLCCEECGEEIDLAAAYEEFKPEIKEIVFNTK